MNIYIYGLFDVLDPVQEIVYVGQTENLAQRLSAHNSTGSKNAQVFKWAKEVRHRGSLVGIKPLETVQPELARDREAHWINQLNPQFNLARPTVPIISLDYFDFNLPAVLPINEIHRLYLLWAERKVGTNKSALAKALGISRPSLYQRLEGLRTGSKSIRRSKPI